MIMIDIVLKEIVMKYNSTCEIMFKMISNHHYNLQNQI